MSKRKICFITGTRAEYGILKLLMEKVRDDKGLEFEIIVTGMHLSPEFGLTYKDIEKDGFEIKNKIEMLLSSDTSEAISKSTGLGVLGFAEAYKRINPQVIVLLGDRFEIYSAAIAALFAKIPMAHIHGGETTEGAFDEAIRHSITKISWWHFVAAKKYKSRVIQLGESPDRVFNVGSLGVEAIKKTNLLKKKALCSKTGIAFSKKNLLVTYHPVTLGRTSSKQEFQNLLDALNEFKDINLIFTMPNADTDGRIINSMINDFVKYNRSRSISFSSLGHLNYLSALQYIDGLIGNSSSGLLEAPTFKIGTINIGDRQKGRLKAKSIIDCMPTKNSIKKAILKLYSNDFQIQLSLVTNPYGGGETSDNILDVLKNKDLPKELKKTFYDLDSDNS